MQKRQWQRWWHAWCAETGSQAISAAGAALAAAILGAALLLIVPGVATVVQEKFTCAVAFVTGGGSCPAGAAVASGGTQTTEQPDPPADPPEEKEDCGGWCQVGGFFKGIGEGAVDTVKGVGTLVVDGVKYAAGDDETREKYAALADAFQEDPWGTTKAVGSAIVEPMVTDWREGRYGEAVGRGVFEVVSTIGGPKGLDKLGKLGKVDDIARATGRVDEITDAGRTISRLPCVGFVMPTGKIAGLAAPLANECDVSKPAMPDGYKRKAAGYERQDIPGENCAYCGRELTDEPRLRTSKEADHIVGLKDAFERGGYKWTESQWQEFSNDLLNQVAACKSCNASKQAKQLFDEWAPPNITPQQRVELLQRIEDVIKKYQLE